LAVPVGFVESDNRLTPKRAKKSWYKLWHKHAYVIDIKGIKSRYWSGA